MANIATYVGNIRNATYGRDVRESIASGIEQCYSDVSGGVTLANTAANKAQTAANNANAAADAANTAASSANSAANKATSAAGSANTATQNANNAATYARSSGEGLQTTIRNAQSALNSANTALNKANTAADRANAAANSVDSAKNNANAAAQRAETAANSVADATHDAAVALSNANAALNQAREATTTATTEAAKATTAATAANTAANNANARAEEASRVNVAMSKAEKVITITTTDRNNISVTKSTQEPTLRVTKSGHEVTVTAVDADGTTSQTLHEAPIDDNAISENQLWSSQKTSNELNTKLGTALKGVAGGLAELDQNGKVPASQLPSYVDDVLEFNTRYGFPSTGEAGKIYVSMDDNLTYRWGGSSYVEISTSLAVGETASTAFAGDKGKQAYNHAMAKGNAYASGLYVIETNAEGHVISARTATKADIGLGNVDNTADIDKPSSPATRRSEENAADSAVAAQTAEHNAEAWAIGERSGVAVGPSDETYQNSSKYYSEVAGGHNTSAQTAKTASETAQRAAEAARDTAVQANSMVQLAKTTTIDAKDAAVSAKSGAEAARDDAETAQNAATAAQIAAETAKTNAETARDAAIQAKTDAIDAKNTILGMSVSATSLAAGSSATVSYANGRMSFGIPAGTRGPGITDITENNDKSLTITYGDGMTVNTRPLQTSDLINDSKTEQSTSWSSNKIVSYIRGLITYDSATETLNIITNPA